MKIHFKKLGFLISLASILSSPSAIASVTFTQNTSTTATVSFDTVTFTASSPYTGNKIYFHIEDFFSATSSHDGAATGGTASLIVGSGTPISLGSGGGNPTGQFTSTIGFVDNNDLFLDLTALSGNFTWSSGNTLTLSGTGLSYGATSINSPAGTATLDARILSGVDASSLTGVEVITQVPEPSSVALLSLGCLAIIRRRR